MNFHDIFETAKANAIQNTFGDKQNIQETISKYDRKLDHYHFNNQEKAEIYRNFAKAMNEHADELENQG